MINDIDEWVEDLYQPGADDPKTLSEVTGKLFYCNLGREYALIDEIFTKIDVTRISTTRLVSTIRHTYQCKDQCKYWYYTLEKINEEFIRRELDNRQLLTGIIKYIDNPELRFKEEKKSPYW